MNNVTTHTHARTKRICNFDTKTATESAVPRHEPPGQQMRAWSGVCAFHNGEPKTTEKARSHDSTPLHPITHLCPARAAKSRDERFRHGAVHVTSRGAPYGPHEAFLPPACSLSAVIVVFTLCIAVFIDSLFLDAWPSEMPRALTPRASASPERVALAWVGGTVTNIIVFELPPSESCSSSVRSDAPKGAFLEALEPSASMTCCSAASDLLAARGASPSPMATAYSAPTRSTRVSLPTEASPLSVLTERTVSVTTRLEPVEVASPLARAPCADARSERTWLAVCTGAVDSPSTCMPNVASRRMRKAGCDAPSESCRSRMASSTISSDERKSSNFIDSSTPVISSKRALTQRCSRPGSAAEPSSV
mmetsp:Transcript_56707/g.150875  ORF Transcript_56707/g.150875 Transcript_56707/m.150875 type:complete len:364 (-) Transcript_56707:586-1677(-)